MVVSDNTQYKSKIMDQLINMPDIVTLINNPDITYSNRGALKNINIFSRPKISGFTSEIKNYICFDFNSRTNPSNKVLKNISFNLMIICHENDIDTDYGNRHDAIDGVIIDAFNWSDFLGFELELVSDVEGILETEYHTRTLQFRNLTPNSLSNGVKMDGY